MCWRSGCSAGGGRDGGGDLTAEEMVKCTVKG